MLKNNHLGWIWQISNESMNVKRASSLGFVFFKSVEFEVAI